MARQAATPAPFAQSAQIALVNGGAGIVAHVDGGTRIMRFTLRNTHFTEFSAIMAPASPADLDLHVLQNGARGSRHKGAVSRTAGVHPTTLPNLGPPQTPLPPQTPPRPPETPGHHKGPRGCPEALTSP